MVEIKRLSLEHGKQTTEANCLFAQASQVKKTWLQFGNEYKLCPMGAMICVVDLVDCRPAIKADAEQAWCEPEDIQDGMLAWVIEKNTMSFLKKSMVS